MAFAVGKEVQVSMEYSRKVPLMANGVALEGSAAGERQLNFGSVHIEEKTDKRDTKPINVSFSVIISIALLLMFACSQEARIGFSNPGFKIQSDNAQRSR